MNELTALLMKNAKQQEDVSFKEIQDLYKLKVINSLKEGKEYFANLRQQLDEAKKEVLLMENELDRSIANFTKDWKGSEEVKEEKVTPIQSKPIEKPQQKKQVAPPTAKPKSQTKQPIATAPSKTSNSSVTTVGNRVLTLKTAAPTRNNTNYDGEIRFKRTEQELIELNKLFA